MMLLNTPVIPWSSVAPTRDASYGRHVMVILSTQAKYVKLVVLFWQFIDKHVIALYQNTAFI